jgi:hypothetical protein
LHELVAKVREGNPDVPPAVITVKSDPTAFLIINLGRENTVFVDSCSGELLGGPVSATDEQVALPCPPPGLAPTFWMLSISKRARLASEMTS